MGIFIVIEQTAFFNPLKRRIKPKYYQAYLLDGGEGGGSSARKDFKAGFVFISFEINRQP